ncbi:sodium:solute symporter [Reichenbachiella versicolor]|uniref:sodium:solute symporter n=1 Tax=Reichenbachiella versicolor TaxID=1821036 RepID=UPI000D6E4ECA|nr:sodium:solute symporter [Reichenbachiella versicolor]
MENIDFHIVDLTIIVLYVIGIVWWALKNVSNSSSEDYFLAGRGMSWPVVGLSLFAAGVSSSSLLGWSGEAYATGLAVFNFQWISVLVMVFFAWFLLPIYLKSGVYTMPEFLERRFDKRSKYYFSLITIISNVFADAAVTLYAGAMLVQLIYPEASIQVIVMVIALVVAAYTIPGGLSSAINAELIQAIILITGAVFLTVAAYMQIDSWETFYKNFENTLTLHIVRPMDDPIVPWLGMIVGIPVLAMYFWGNNQMLVQRILSAKSIDHGRKGMFLTGILMLLTLYIFIFPGVWASYLYPGLKNPDQVYPKLIKELMPIGLVGVIIASLIAALASSFSAVINSASTIFTMDFYSRIAEENDTKKLVRVGQIASGVIVLVAALWAPYVDRFGTLVKYYQSMISYVAPPIVCAFILGVFWKRATATGAFSGLISGLGVAVLLLFFKDQTFLGGLHFLLMIPLIALISLVVMVAVSILTQPHKDSEIRELVWDKTLFYQESRQLKHVKWYNNYRILSFMVIVACFFFAIIYW